MLKGYIQTLNFVCFSVLLAIVAYLPILFGWFNSEVMNILWNNGYHFEVWSRNIILVIWYLVFFALYFVGSVMVDEKIKKLFKS